uniref:Reverse transcriptase zinc-binding domain-containing protein n=1 Tax=Fagus sylvatica TaxID=28930 RepID=A0A2N9I8Q2_FAGSY
MNCVTKIFIPTTPIADKLIWIADPKGIFSVKSAHRLQQSHIWPSHPDPIWQKLWKCKLHERLKTFVWRIGIGVLPTNSNVFSRLSKGDPCCPLCKSDMESTSHLFFKCLATKLFWFGLSWGIGPDSIPITTDMDIVNLVVHPPIGPGTPSKAKNPLTLLKSLELKIIEYIQSSEGASFSDISKQDMWCPKFNVDAAFHASTTIIAAIAMDDSGNIIKAWAKVTPIDDPTIAKASAIL